MVKTAVVLAAALLAGACAVAPPRADAFSRLQQGMTRDEVRRLAGPPDETMRFPLSRSESWDYRYYDPWGYLALLSVTFAEDGRVASVLSQRLNDGGDHGT